MGKARSVTEDDENTGDTTTDDAKTETLSDERGETSEQPGTEPADGTDTAGEDGDDGPAGESAAALLDRAKKKSPDRLGGSSLARLPRRDHTETVADGLGGKETARLEPAEMSGVIAEGKEGRIFPVTLGCESDGTVKARTLVAKLRPDAGETSVEASRMMETSRRVEVYEEERLRDIHDSSFFNLLASTSLGATLKKVDIFAEQAASFGSRKETRTEKSKRKLFVSAVWECRKATIAVPEKEIVIAEDVETRVGRLLTENPELRNVELLEHDVFSTCGILVPLRYVLGGRYRKKEHFNSELSLSA